MNSLLMRFSLLPCLLLLLLVSIVFVSSQSIVVPSSGTELIGQTYTDSVTLTGVLAQGAKITVRNCKFTGTLSSLHIVTFFQRGVEVVIENNVLSGGIRVQSSYDNKSVCSEPQSNSDPIKVTIKNNVANGELHLSGSASGSTLVGTLLLCGRDSDVPGGGFAGVQIFVVGNTADLTADGRWTRYVAISIFSKSWGVRNLDGWYPEDAPERLYVAYARLDHLEIKGNTIKYTHRHADGKELICHGIQFGWPAANRSAFFRPSPSLVAAVTRTSIIEGNIIDVQCTSDYRSIVSGFEQAYIGNRITDVDEEGMGIYKLVNLDYQFINNKISIKGSTGSAIALVPRPPSRFLTKIATAFSDKYNGLPLNDSSLFVFPEITAIFRGNSITVDLSMAAVTSHAAGIKIGFEAVLRAASVLCEHNTITSLGPYEMSGIEVGDYMHLITIRDNQFFWKPQRQRSTVAERFLKFNWHAVNVLLNSYEVPEEWRRPRLLVERSIVHVVDTYHSRSVSLIGSIQNLFSLVVDRCEVHDSVGITVAPSWVRIFSAWGPTSIGQMPRVGNYTLMNCFLRTSASSVTLFSLGSPIYSILFSNVTLVATANWKFESVDETITDKTICVFSRILSVIISARFSRVNVTCLYYGDIRVISGPTAAPYMSVEDSTIVSVGHSTNSALHFERSPFDTKVGLFYLPHLVVARNNFKLSGGGAFFMLVTVITSGEDEFTSLAPIDMAPLGFDPTIEFALRPVLERVRRSITTVTYNATNHSSFVNVVVPFDMPNTTDSLFPPNIMSQLESISIVWIFEDNEVQLRCMEGGAAIFSLNSIHVPPIRFSGRNAFECGIWSRADPSNVFADSAGGGGAEAALIYPMLVAMGIDTASLSNTQARFISASSATLENIILGGGGGGACSSYNGRKLTGKLVERHLALEAHGLARVLGGTGQCPPADYHIAESGCVWTQSRSLPRTKSRTLELTRTETRTLTLPPTRTATNTSIFVEVQNPLKEAGEIAAVIMAVAAVAAVLSIAVAPASALSVARMMAVLGVVQGLAENDCGGRPSDEPPDFVSSPLQINFGSSSGGFLLGTTVGNLLLLLIVTLVCTVSHYAYLRWWKKAPPEEIPGVAKLLQESKTMPGLVVVLDIVLFPTLGAALVLVVRSEERVTVMVRLLSVVLAAAIVGSLSWWLWKMLFQRVRHERFQRKDATGENNTNISSIRSRREEGRRREREQEEEEEDEYEFGTSAPGPIAAWCAAAALPVTRFLGYLTDGEGEWQMPSEREVQSIQRKQNSRRSRSNNNNSNEDLEKAASVASITDKDRELFQLAEPLIEGYVDRAPRFMVMEFVTQLGLSLAMMLGEIVAERIGCMVQAGLILLALAAYLAMVVLWRPYQDRWSWGSTLALTVVELITLSMALAGVPPVPFLAVAMIALAGVQLVVALVSLAIWLLTIGYPALAAMLQRCCKRREYDDDEEQQHGDGDDEFSRFERRQNEQLRGREQPNVVVMSERERRMRAATSAALDHRARSSSNDGRGERGGRHHEASSSRRNSSNNNRRRHLVQGEEGDGQELLLQHRRHSSSRSGQQQQQQQQQRRDSSSHRRHFELDRSQLLLSPSAAAAAVATSSPRRQQQESSSSPRGASGSRRAQTGRDNPFGPAGSSRRDSRSAML